ncbi:hypothetical protein TCDM_12593 [Trypanosoma cruzi Dm28c]|uniref:Trans-sialidase n=1 Tax=Trypanosoma cruzi Dm28c TaxID=1416333 RepID=V5AUV1_TRYCR|nr:hypothetical protein TCDM_12593 [Trypanosoma cruzi Dm28c]
MGGAPSLFLFCFYCIEWATSLTLPLCVFCFTGAMRVCALVVPRFGFLFCFLFDFVVECTHSAGCVCVCVMI